MMKRWIVNPKDRTVREQPDDPYAAVDARKPGEFFYDAPTYADAMAAGQRRRLAEEAMRATNQAWIRREFRVVADRIEPATSELSEVVSLRSDLQKLFAELGFDVWSEGTGLVVLGRLP